MIDPNAVPLPVISALPKVGTVLAGRIVGERRTAPITSIGDLEYRVRGVGPATAAAIRPYLRFEADAQKNSPTTP